VTQQRAPRRPPRSVFIVPLGLVARIAVAVLVLAVLVGLIASGVIARAASGTMVADRATVDAHQAAAERGIERGYEASTDQVRKARALKLAIGAQQADAIASKALTDLATLRHSALLSLAQTLGVTADAAETYATSAEHALDAKRGQPQPSLTPVLLAPRLYAIVARFNDLATQLSDQATTDLTQSSTTTPTAPSSSPSASPRPTPTPSPTR
jgi:hypothetical protein